MSRYQLIVLTRAKPGRREAFERWYDERHIPDCLRVPGVISATRHSLLHGLGRAEDGLPVEAAEFDSLAIYELETEDPDAAARDLISRAGTPDMPPSEDLDRSSIVKFITRRTTD